jgi:Carboxypeptidase regulatory-like domain
MAVPPVSLKCANCGTALSAVVAPSPPTQWFPCPHCRAPVPVLVPRDPPVLYTWEVLPGLYPSLPRPRAPRWRVRSVAAAALIAVAIAAIGVGGALAYYGAEATHAAEYTVSGTVVYGPTGAPVTGATVNLTEDNGSSLVQVTSFGGTFSFAHVPSGGISINVTHPGDAPVTVTTFASPAYDAGTTGLTIGLYPGGASNGTSVSLAPFPDLESFLASIGGAAILLALIATVAGAAAVVARRPSVRTATVIGGSAGVAAPAVLALLGLSTAFPYLLLVAALAGACGAFAAAMGAGELLVEGTEA